MVMNGYDTDADGENNFYTVNGRTFYYARYPIRVKRNELVRLYLANLTEFDLINSFHLHADFFRYQPTGTGDNWEYTDTVMQCQGQRGVLEIELRPRGDVHVPRAPVRVHRARLDGLLPGRGLTWRPGARASGGLGLAALGARPARPARRRGRARRLARRPRRRPRGREPAAGRRVRRAPGRVPRGRDPRPGAEPAARRPDDRGRHGRRRDRPVHARRPRDARAAPLEHDRDPVRVGRGRPDRDRGHELDGDPDDHGGAGRAADARARRPRLPRLRADRRARRRRPRRARPPLAARRCAAHGRSGWPRSWRSRPVS